MGLRKTRTVQQVDLSIHGYSNAVGKFLSGLKLQVGALGPNFFTGVSLATYGEHLATVPYSLTLTRSITLARTTASRTSPSCQRCFQPNIKASKA